MSSKLEEAGEKISDSLLTAKIFNSLPKSFKSFVTIFECTRDLTFDTLRAKLSAETKRRKLKKTALEKFNFKPKRDSSPNNETEDIACADWDVIETCSLLT